ncbi:MAG TPA: DEAD/DEAH box helicase [Solirubrobacteraceae bacterium]|jgi:ATP-dependent RNA helicase RhlE|nr:DEAD/DEAH box helicase [Solirubrobacteraceae bacterium]
MSTSQSFADLGVSRAVTNALASQGIDSPFAIQRDVIGDVLQGRDVLVKSPTGSGKTLAFGIPLVDRTSAEGPRPTVLVLAPTRELVTQIVAQITPIAHARALRVTAVYGGVGLVAQAKNAARSHVIVATPGRLEDLLARRAFSLDQIKMLVLDEADRMLDMGFRPAVDRIAAQCPRARQTLFFSATLDGEAGRLAQRYTRDPAMHEHGPTERRAHTDVEHRFIEIAHSDRVEALVHELRQERGLTLVFVRTKRGADRLVKRLGTHGIHAVAMHGNKSQRQREQALARFQSGAVDTLVATDVAARGIDVKDISHVINFDPPGDSETYVHRVGRTARAGATGIGITLVAHAERGDVGHLARSLGLDHPVAHGHDGHDSRESRPAPRNTAPSHGARGRRPRRRGKPRRAAVNS